MSAAWRHLLRWHRRRGVGQAAERLPPPPPPDGHSSCHRPLSIVNHGQRYWPGFSVRRDRTTRHSGTLDTHNHLSSLRFHRPPILSSSTSSGETALAILRLTTNEAKQHRIANEDAPPYRASRDSPGPYEIIINTQAMAITDAHRTTYVAELTDILTHRKRHKKRELQVATTAARTDAAAALAAPRVASAAFSINPTDARTVA
jgi:hypothetical protein